jgi:MFS transporter, DHA1 family, tetracycline resistance protein
MKKNSLIVIFITVFVDLVGFGMIIPQSPYLAQTFGATSFQVGLLMAAYSAAQFLFSPFWGQLSDQIGRRPVILISLFGAALAHLGFSLADSLWMLFVARIFAGLFGANISTALAAIADVTSNKDRAKGMGIVGAAFGLGFVLGPAIGGFLSKYGPSVPALAAAGICAANGVLAIFVFPETRAAGSPKAAGMSRLVRLRKHFARPKVGGLLGMAFVCSFALANMEASLFLLVGERFSWSVETASYGFAFLGVMMAFTQGFLIRKLLPRFGEANLIRWGVFLFSAGMLLIALGTVVGWVALGLTGVAVGNGLLNPSLMGLISVKSSGDEQGEVMGVMQSLSALARIFGPPVGGYLFGAAGSGSPFYLASGLAFCAGLWFWKGIGPSPATSMSERKSEAESPLSFDLLSVGSFQLENILRVAADTKVYDLRTQQETAKDKTAAAWSRVEWMMAKTIPLSVDLNSDTLFKVIDPATPMIFICANGAGSKALTQDLDQRGFRNVYYLSGGTAGLLQDD